VLAYTQSPLTTPPSASVVAPPPTTHTIDIFDACRTQCGAFGAVGGACTEGRTDWPVPGVSCKHARRSTTPRPLLHPSMSPERQHRQTRQQIACVGRGKRCSVARAGQEHYLDRVHRLPSSNHQRCPCELRCPANLVLAHGLNRPQYKTLAWHTARSSALFIHAVLPRC